MEKFGIFELLDTLSAIIGTPAAPPAAPPAAKTRPDPADAAFAPPSYAGTPPAQDAPNAALSSFLENHEKRAKRTEGGK